jgi:hypothetical protein
MSRTMMATSTIWTMTSNGNECLSQNFTLAYIYYWMEVDVNDINGAYLLPPLSSLSSWGACPSARPIPMLMDASGGGATTKRWRWLFWKQG